MTLFFNWNKLVKLSKGDSNRLLAIISKYYDNKVKALPQQTHLSGTSFLLNPKDLFKDTQTDVLYIHQYINLAALRDYSFYKLYGVKSLQLSYYPEINLSSIRHNPLLNVTNTEIYFKYEEIENGTKIR